MAPEDLCVLSAERGAEYKAGRHHHSRRLQDGHLPLWLVDACVSFLFVHQPLSLSFNLTGL